jgi:hypothetical protein
MSDERAKITSLRELPQEIAPPRDLWPQLEARLAAEPRRARPLRDLVSRPLVAAAALVFAVAVGIGIGRLGSPSHTTVIVPGAGAGAMNLTPTAYARDRAALLAALPAQLAALPPDSRAKVAASLATIQKSIKDIQAALGREPGNALLQGLLVDSYQDEMRVLTSVQEAAATGREI